MPETLPELRDIHIPSGVSSFPIAYGWWVILLAIILLIAIFFIIRLIYHKSQKLYALRIVNNLDINNIKTSASIISSILRRVCVQSYPSAVSLSGADWINFLNSHAKQSLNPKASQLLLNAPYMPASTQTYKTLDIQNLKSFAVKWIGENL